MRLLLVIVSFSFVGCTHISATRVDSTVYPALADTATVAVYGVETDVPRPFTTVAIINFTDPGKYQVLDLNDAIPGLKAKARALGANGIVIDQSQTTKSGWISTGISVRARAVRVAPLRQPAQ